MERDALRRRLDIHKTLVMKPDLKPPVRAALERLRYWERRREQDEHDNFSFGDAVWYKDERVAGVITELLDGSDERKNLVGKAGAMVSFRNRAAVPVFLWALRPPETP
jgi:hypothetical protein